LKKVLGKLLILLRRRRTQLAPASLFKVHQTQICFTYSLPISQQSDVSNM